MFISINRVKKLYLYSVRSSCQETWPLREVISSWASPVSCKTIFDPLEIVNRLERTYELSIQLVGEKFCCRVMKYTIKVIHFKHCLPMTQGNHRANGREEIMTHQPEWICNTEMPYKYALYLSWRLRLWANKTNAKVQNSLYIITFCRTRTCWKFVI